MAVQRIPTGINVILLIGPQLAGAEQFNAGDLQAGAAILPAEILARDSAQAVRQHLRLAQARRHQPPGLTVDFAAFAEGADSRLRGCQPAVDENSATARQPAALGQPFVRLYAGRQYYPRGGKRAAVLQQHLMFINGGDTALHHAADPALGEQHLQLFAGKGIGLLLHQPASAVQ